MNYQKIYSDDNYASALNYDGRNYYNSPCTIEIEGKKFILTCGTSDRTTVVIREDMVYVIAENTALDYIGMDAIDLSDNTVSNVFLEANDLNTEENYCFKLLEKETDEQLQILCEYLFYQNN